MKVLITGDRNWNDVKFLHRCLDKAHTKLRIKTLIEGGARGVDKIAHYWGQANNIECITEKAYWDISGKAAGPLRNQRMIDNHSPDICIAFHDDIENSRGTKDMINKCKKHKIPVYLHSHKNPDGVMV